MHLVVCRKSDSSKAPYFVSNELYQSNQCIEDEDENRCTLMFCGTLLRYKLSFICRLNLWGTGIGNVRRCDSPAVLTADFIDYYVFFLSTSKLVYQLC